MTNRNFAARALALGLAAGMLALPGCYAESYGGGVGVSASIAGDYGWEPQYYDGYVVYYDDVGRPYYYSRGARIFISTGSPYYPRYVRYYRTHRPAYLRWYARHGHQYRGHRLQGGYYGGYRGYRYSGPAYRSPGSRGPEWRGRHDRRHDYREHRRR